MAAERKLLTLTDLSKQTGISMPTLQRYKKLYQRRIPSVGEGRKQRYPKAAVKVVLELKKENLAKRGRPRKKASAKGAAKRRSVKRVARKPAKKAVRKTASARRGRSRGSEMLSLAEVGRQTGISYPTLLRYVKANLKNIPHEGRGRKRRFHPDAVAIFADMRANSRRGRRKGSGKPKAARASAVRATAAGAGLERRLKALEKSQADIAKELRAILAQLKNPIPIMRSLLSFFTFF